MKKIFALAAAFCLLILTSCSDDSTSTATRSNAILLQKTIEQYEDGSLLMTNYQYDGTKLTDITYSDGRRTEFTYTRDQVTRADYADSTGIGRWETFVYDAEGSVSEMSEYGTQVIPGEEGEEPQQIQWAIRTTYTYNADGTVSLAMFSGNHESQTEPASVATVTTANGNVTAYTAAARNSTYAFDANHNPQINITGLAPLYIAWLNGGVNNVTSANTTNETDSYSVTYNYTYNSKGYPVSAVREENTQISQIWYLY